MQLHAVELHDFRNLGEVLVEPHAGLNVLAGPNGQGKTNFLEAVYLLGTLRPLRHARLDELVRWGARVASVRARAERRELARLYEVELRAGSKEKKARVDGKAVRTAEYFGGFNVVLFCPEDLRLVRGAPEGRRRFLDRAVWNAEPSFLVEAQAYERILKTRNAVLRELKPDAAALLEVYDAQLARAGATVISRRRRLLAALAPLAERAHARIARSGLALDVRLGGRFADVDEAMLETRLRERFAETRRRDLERGFTGSGPHTSDLELMLDGRPARVHASQGQVRAIVLALKIAEIEHLRAVLGEPPILLLDDVSSELDPQRTAALFEFVGGLGAQAFLTTTAPDHLPLPADRREFQVFRGAIQG